MRKYSPGQFGASIDLLHVFSNPYDLAVYTPEVYAPLPPEMRERALEEAREYLSARAHAGRRATLRWLVLIAIDTGLTAPQIVKYADEHGIDLIVMGTHGRRGVAHLLLGSVAEHVIRTAACPVLTVRDPGARKHERDDQATTAKTLRSERQPFKHELFDAIPDLIAIDAKELGSPALASAGAFERLCHQLPLDLLEIDALWGQTETALARPTASAW
jgi:nucleotide-binding universal stress UspA family protein